MIILYLILFALGLALYFLPSIIARNKKNFAAIFVLNLLLGWSFFGWIAALVWSLCHESKDKD